MDELVPDDIDVCHTCCSRRRIQVSQAGKQVDGRVEQLYLYSLAPDNGLGYEEVVVTSSSGELHHERAEEGVGRVVAEGAHIGGGACILLV